MKADRSRKNGRAQKSKNRRKRPCQAAQGMPRRRYRRGRWNAERGSSAQNRFESGGGCAIIKLSAARQGAAYCRWGESRMKKNGRRWLWVVLAAVLLAAAGFGIRESRRSRPHSAMGFAMDTVVTQTAYGPQAEAGTQAVTRCLAQLEARLSLYVPTSELAAVNAAAGRQPVAVSDDTFALLAQTLALSARSQGAFQATVAPLTQLWGNFVSAPDSQIAAADGAGEWCLQLLALAIVPAVLEEALFRGVVLQTLLDSASRFGAGMLTTLFFSLLHGNLAALPAHLLFGGALTLAEMRTGNLLVPMVMHAVYNASALFWRGMSAWWLIFCGAAVLALGIWALMTLPRTAKMRMKRGHIMLSAAILLLMAVQYLLQ